MVRREVYRRLLPFDPQFRNWADVDLWMRLCATHAIAYVPEPLISLDQTPTPVRAFNWDKFLIAHRMHIVNIHRMAQDPTERADWLRRQRRWTWGRYLRNLNGRLIRGEFASLAAGLRLRREVATRLFEPDWRLTESGPVDFVPLAPEASAPVVPDWKGAVAP